MLAPAAEFYARNRAFDDRSIRAAEEDVASFWAKIENLDHIDNRTGNLKKDLVECFAPGALDRVVRAEHPEDMIFWPVDDVTWCMARAEFEGRAPKQRRKFKLPVVTTKGVVNFRCDELQPLIYRVGEDKRLIIIVPAHPLRKGKSAADMFRGLQTAQTGNHEGRAWRIRVPTAEGQPVRG